MYNRVILQITLFRCSWPIDLKLSKNHEWRGHAFMFLSMMVQGNEVKFINRKEEVMCM